MSVAAIEALDVYAGYGGRPVVKALSMTVAEGEFAALIGPNGAGKTTLLRALTGLHPLTSGVVRLFGRDIRRLSATERAQLVAAAPQDLVLTVPFTVEEVVGIGRTARLPRWQRPGVDHRRAVESAMERMEVLELRGRRFDELSAGERQRILIAMALAQEPRILLLDEPTAHLDIGHRLEILDRIRALNRQAGLTVLMTSHDLNTASQYGRRLFVLDRGQLVADGPVERVFREPLLSQVYQCRLRVRRDEDGVWSVWPASRS